MNVNEICDCNFNRTCFNNVAKIAGKSLITLIFFIPNPTFTLSTFIISVILSKQVLEVATIVTNLFKIFRWQFIVSTIVVLVLLPPTHTFILANLLWSSYLGATARKISDEAQRRFENPQVENEAKVIS